MADFIKPNWPAPANIKAFSTLRTGGVSQAPYDSLNLGIHVEDKKSHVEKNRELLTKMLSLPSSPRWLTQTHSHLALHADTIKQPQEADASFTSTKNTVCAVLTADCLPILVCDKQGTQVAAIHAGWRGLTNGIIENTLKQLSGPATDLMAWLGPAIGPNAFEVGEDVYKAFPQSISAFKSKSLGKWYADIYALAKQQLCQFGISRIYGGEHCTFSEPKNFFSYRRDGQCGRMATLIYIT